LFDEKMFNFALNYWDGVNQVRQGNNNKERKTAN